MNKELNDNLIWQLSSLIKNREARLTKLNKSLSDSLSVSQTAMFDGMSKTGYLFNDQADQAGQIKKVSAELSDLRQQLAKAQDKAEFLEQTKNVLPIEF